MSNHWAEELVSHGKIQLSSAKKYHDESSYGEEIGDITEGKVDEYSLLDNENKPFEHNHVTRELIDGNINGATFRNCLTVLQHDYSNNYIFCTSKMFSLSLMRRFSKDYNERYDTCIKITHPEEFFQLITSKILELKRSSHFITTSRCLYRASKPFRFDEKNRDHPLLYKPLKHEHQHEVRSIWEIENSPLDIPLEIPDLGKYCKVHYIDKPDIKDGYLDIARVTNFNFESDIIELDGHIFENCTAKDLVCFFNASHPTIHYDIECKSTKLVFDNAALRTVDYLRHMYAKSTNQQYIADVIEYIKGTKDSF